MAELLSAKPDRQRKIAFELGRRGAKLAVAALRVLLKSQDAEVRAAAAEALGKIGDDSVRSDLARLLADERQPVFVRDTCAYALARLAYMPALDILLVAVKDPHATVRTCAVSAIAAIVSSKNFKPGKIHAVQNQQR